MAWIWPAVATIGSALISSRGQANANQANIQQAQATNEFNAEQAQIGREFNSGEAQINREWSANQAAQAMEFSSNEASRARTFNAEMSGTAYTRAVGDLRNAGLNPMLAYQQGGASSPTSPSPSGVAGQSTAASGGAASGSRAEVFNEYAPAFSSAAGIMKQFAEIDKIKAETDTERNRPDNVTMDTVVKSRTFDKMTEEIHNLRAREKLTDEQAKEVIARTQVLIEEQGIAAANMQLKRFEMQVREATSREEIAAAVRETNAWESSYGVVRPGVRDQPGGSANSLMRFFRMIK